MKNLNTLKLTLPAAVLFLQAALTSVADTYYIDADGGSDGNSGLSTGQAWATLAHASAQHYGPGDQILLQRGDTFTGKIVLDGDSGTSGNRIVVGAYGVGELPVINTSGYLAGVHIKDAGHIEIRDLEITGDGGAMVDGSPESERFGVYLSGRINHIVVDNLYIHHIFPDIGSEHEGAMDTTHLGYGVAMRGDSLTTSGNITVKNCRMAYLGFKAIEMKHVSFVELLDNYAEYIGGPALQPGNVNDLVVRGNTIHHSGSFIDPRMHGRGSGIWPWTCERVLIERNVFTGARGRADSCGIHIDFNCRDVVVQYNLSVDNSGGFIEILGNDYNCTYRYNISINDGSRIKGEPSNGPGTKPNNQDGHILWISGFVGNNSQGNRPPSGPFNNYIYNNTIFVKSDIVGRFSIQDTFRGLLVANNIFYVEGESEDITGDWADNYTQEDVDSVVWKNNLYQRVGIVPTFYENSPDQPSFTDTAPRYGDPLFANAGGLNPGDYIPSARALIEEQGIAIENLPGDDIGLRIGFEVTEDFFGNPILGQPDMGAIEIGGTAPPLPDAAFAEPPAAEGKNSIAMSSVGGPLGTQYYFHESTGNAGGNDSGWLDYPVYRDDGLLPNTRYAYAVTLRDILGNESDPGQVVQVLTPKSVPFEEQVLLFEDFSATGAVDNSAAPFPPETWYISNENDWNSESQSHSAARTDSGEFRTGWGYDEVVTQWYSSEAINPDRDYRFSGDWKIDNADLDVHLGQVVGLGEYDANTGNLVTRIKESIIGELESPATGMSGSFVMDISRQELQSAGTVPGNKVGVFLHHNDGGALMSEHATLRNDVYLLDNLELTILSEGTDTDQDGIPDAVESVYGLNPHNPADAQLDLDGDGISNLAEYVAGTSLTDPTDYFSVNLLMGDSCPELTMETGQVMPGRLYILEKSSALSAWSAKDYVSGTSANPQLGHSFRLNNADVSDFYRIRVEWE